MNSIVGQKMSSEYFVDIISNSSMDIHPDNTLSRFTNRLPKRLDLDGNWFVAVQEVFYPLSHKPMKRVIPYYIRYGAGRKHRMLEFAYTENDSIEQIIEELNSNMTNAYKIDGIGDIEGINEADIKPPSISKESIEGKDRVVIKSGSLPDSYDPVFPIFRDHMFLRTLGFDLSIYYDQLNSATALKTMTANHKPDIGPKSHLMFIYTDIIHDHFVGDITSRVLRVVPLEKGEGGDKLGHMSFNNPYYYPVRFNKIEDISIILRDETGNRIKFKNGRVYLSLHFKRIDIV